MPPKNPPAQQDPAGDGDGEDGRIRSLDERFGAIEREQAAQRTLLGRIGTPAAPAGPTSAEPGADPRTVAELVRDGVAELEARKRRKERRQGEKDERADHAARIKALEERAPREVAATPAGRFRSWVQKRGFGIDDPSR